MTAYLTKNTDQLRPGDCIRSLREGSSEFEEIVSITRGEVVLVSFAGIARQRELEPGDVVEYLPKESDKFDGPAFERVDRPITRYPENWRRS